MIEIEPVDALEFRLTTGVWDFAERRAAEIAAHWERRVAEQPGLFNGRVLVLGPHAIEARGAERVLTGAFVETDFAAFLAWREFGFPASNACNGFAMAALRDPDGAFLLGEMAPHTASAGAIYFPAGTPDRQDVFGDVVDLGASAIRELSEETGLDAAEVEIASGWVVVRAPGRLACMKPMTLRVSGRIAKARIEAALAADPKPEFSQIHLVRGEADVLPAVPEFVRAYMTYMRSGEGASRLTKPSSRQTL